MRLIDADALSKRISDLSKTNDNIYYYKGNAQAWAQVINAPTIVHEKHGHWNVMRYVGSCECSECGSIFSTLYRYCPQCGAIMNGKKDDDQDGRWILHDVHCPESYECSNCHVKYEYDKNEGCDKWKYCPNCGNRKKIK